MSSRRSRCAATACATASSSARATNMAQDKPSGDQHPGCRRERALGGTALTIRQSDSAGVRGWFMERAARAGLIRLGVARASPMMIAPGGKAAFSAPALRPSPRRAPAMRRCWRSTWPPRRPPRSRSRAVASGACRSRPAWSQGGRQVQRRCCARSKAGRPAPPRSASRQATSPSPRSNSFTRTSSASKASRRMSTAFQGAASPHMKTSKAP